MNVWLQLALSVLFWVAFWSALAVWAYREARRSAPPRRPDVRDLYPPRIHASQAAETRPAL